MHGSVIRREMLYLLLLFAGLLIACGSNNGGGEPLTVEEYADECGGDPYYVSGMTWGEYGEKLSERLKDARKFNPPDKLQDFHDGVLVVMESMSEYVDKQPDHETAVLEEAIQSSIVEPQWEALGETADKLDDATRNILAAYNCWR